jgi:hypothetical protein
MNVGAAIRVLVVDVDLDGDPDIVVGRYSSNLSLLRNLGGRSFAPPETIALSQSHSGWVAAISRADLDGDGDPDLIASYHDTMFDDENFVAVLLNAGDGTFWQHQIHYAGTGVGGAGLVDLDGDPFIDLAVSTGFGTAIARGRGDGSFREPAFFGGGATLTGDFDEDGDQDLVSSAALYPNGRCDRGDLDSDGVIGRGDVDLLMTWWGPCPPWSLCPADLDGDEQVGIGDLLALLHEWVLMNG